MKKITCLLLICVVSFLMTKCSNSTSIVPDSDLQLKTVVPIENNWDLKSLSILQNIKFNTINEKIKSLSEEELKNYERDIVTAYDEYTKNPSKESLGKYIGFLGYTDINDFLFKDNAEKRYKEKIFKAYYNSDFSTKNIQKFSIELSKIYTNNNPTVNSTQATPYCGLVCANTNSICLAEANNAYNNATSGSCTLNTITGCQPIYQWTIIGVSVPNSMVNGCLVVRAIINRNFGPFCDLGPTPFVVVNDVFKYDYDPSRANQMIIYNAGPQTNDCNDYNSYNSCLAIKKQAKEQADIIYAIAVAKCALSYSTCLNGCQ
ncbi:hypothetical protein ABID42_000445 [Arcicella rosea]|uniref:hypothetical protein n=1 Tax=Arcicella rosea TaxID=502909 RepID=UPI00345CDEF1